MTDSNWDEFGWPTQVTRVHSTRAVIFPAPMRTAEREKKNARERARFRQMKRRTRKALRKAGYAA